MMKLYIAGGILIALACVYWTGGRIATEQCRADVANIRAKSVINLQNEIIKTKGMINAETYTVGIADVRRRLHAKYTIAD